MNLWESEILIYREAHQNEACITQVGIEMYPSPREFKMKWYFASNNQSPDYVYMIKAAVESALKNTRLEPHFLYDGSPDALTAWLERKGVKIIYHRVSFYDRLKAFYPPDQLKIAAGAFLRCDIPLLETKEDSVLYTDCDVLFLNGIDPQNIPRAARFTCAPETRQTDWSILNTGVMWMNLPALRKTHADFVAFINDRLPELATYDQTAYNLFYAGQHTRLPLEYNWKPYWGENSDAKIIHFHGPKPHDILHILQGEPISEIYKSLFALDRFGSIHYLSRFCEYSNALSIDSETALTTGARFLADALAGKETDLKAAQKKLLWSRLKKNYRRLIEQKTL